MRTKINLFYLNPDPQLCAQQHCDKHVVKMILEYAQLLSTAHRVLDGEQTFYTIWQNGQPKQKSILLLPGEYVFVEDNKPVIGKQAKCYKASHMKHPDAIWCRESVGNYKYLWELFFHLCQEYEHRYGKVHSAVEKTLLLTRDPRNLPKGEFTEPPLCMPDEFKVDDVVTSYQNLYVGSKSRFAKWTNRRPPDWFIERIPEYDETHFERTKAVAVPA